MLLTRQTNKTNIIFDFEVFPEWWVCCFRSAEDGLETSYISSDDYGYVALLQDKLRKHRLIGFNCKMYDLLIYNAILCNVKPEGVYKISQDIISGKKTNWTENFNHYRWDWIDLFNDWKYGSLKMYEASKGLSIVESSIPFGKKNLTDEDKKEIISYCFADTWATYSLWKDREDYFGIHKFVSEKYGIPLNKAYQKTMQSLTATAMKAQSTPDDFVEDKTQDIYVLDYIYEILKLSPFDYIASLSDDDDRVFMFDGDRFMTGVGGVHSDYDYPVIAESDDKHQLWTIDFTQYYPNMLTKFKLTPRSVPMEGVEIYVDMIHKVEQLKAAIAEEHDAAKKKVMKSERNKYKVLINAVTGAMRSKFSKFYDPSRVITMCAVGQFLLIAIVEDLKKTFPGTEILQTNTDGAYMMMPKDADVVAKMQSIMDRIKFAIEVEPGQKMIQRDVNNYIWLTPDGKAKTKGAWTYSERPDFSPLKYAVAHKAVYELLVNDKPIEDTVREDRDIMDFVCCAKTGSTFEDTVYITTSGEQPTTATNRFVASKNVRYGILQKIKFDDQKGESRSVVPDCPPNCLLLNNDISTYNFDDLNIDYDYYIKFAYDLLPNFYRF